MSKETIEILERYKSGKISEGECWELLGNIRLPKKEYVMPDRPKETPKVYKPISEGESKVIEALQRVHFGMSSSAKRFSRDIRNAKELTDAQRDFLKLLILRYRRQLFRAENPDNRAKEFIRKAFVKS